MSVKRTLNNMMIIMMVIILPINTAGITVYHHFCFETGNTSSKLAGKTDCSDMKDQNQDIDICDCDDESEHPSSMTAELNNSNLTLIDKTPCCIDTSVEFVVSVPFVLSKSDLHVNNSFIRDFELISFSLYSFNNDYNKLILLSPEYCICEYDPVNYLIKTIQHLSSTKTDIPNLA